MRLIVRAASVTCVVAVLAACAPASAGPLPPPMARLSPVASDGFFGNTLNSVAINRNNLVTVGNYQFIAFYDAFQSLPGPDDQATVKLGRRLLGTDAWTVTDTGFAPVNVNDDHDNVAIAVDGDGYMHMSWGMHNNPMNFVVSNAPVTGPTVNFSGSSFTGAPYWTGTAANNDSSVTYPEFYNIPGSKDLLFVYRQGASGNGDAWITRYDATSKTFDKNRVINGVATGVNAYLNNLAYDSTGTLNMSWTWRSTPAFQTNHNIMFARSGDDGQTWVKQSGGAFSLPITEGQGGVIANIPEQSTLINQTSMALDSQDRPLIATWYAPLAASGDHTRQYMLHWFDGAAWHASQITDRPGEAKQTDATVRELGRPIVLVDDADRTLVVMRYKEVDDNIVVAVSEDRQNWDFITLASADMGLWEPTYDAALWERENKLHLFYQQLGTGGSGDLAVLEWDAKGYFASIPEPSSLAVALAAVGLLMRRQRRAR